MKVYNLGSNLLGIQSYKINKATSTRFQDKFDIFLIISFSYAEYRSLIEQ